MKLPILTFAVALLSVPASAATIGVSAFSKSSYDSAVGTMSRAVIQNFEGTTEGNVANGFATNVGAFATMGGEGTGGTVTGADFNNDGTMLALRDGNVYGRTSTTKMLTGNMSDDMFLDSNDTYGISWNVALEDGAMFNRIVFTVSDAAEFGNTLMIATHGGATLVESAGNGLKRLIEIRFDEAVSSTSVVMTHFRDSRLRTNDGFSIDDIAVSAVPLPASALLLLGGLGGLAMVRRRKA